MPSNELPESLRTALESAVTLEKSTALMKTTSPGPVTEEVGNSTKRTADDSQDQQMSKETAPHADIVGHDGAAIMSYKNKTALDRFEKSVGGRENVIDTLSLATLDKKQEHFLRLLCDPHRAKDSLVTIARDAGLLPSHIIELFRNASTAKAFALGMGQLSEAIPAIIKDVTDKSVDAKVECPTCFGTKYFPENVQCPRCGGVGEVFRASDLDRQKIALESIGITKKGGGVNVNVNQQVGVVSPNTFFSKYVKSSDEAAYDVDGFVDAETND